MGESFLLGLIELVCGEYYDYKINLEYHTLLQCLFDLINIVENQFVCDSPNKAVFL